MIIKSTRGLVMQLNEIKVKINELNNMKDDKKLWFVSVEAMVTYCVSVNGYVVVVIINGVPFTVSSQREDKRVFKSLDTLRNQLKDISINQFTVTG